jgi:hypothetical protein
MLWCIKFARVHLVLVSMVTLVHYSWVFALYTKVEGECSNTDICEQNPLCVPHCKDPADRCLANCFPRNGWHLLANVCSLIAYVFGGWPMAAHIFGWFNPREQADRIRNGCYSGYYNFEEGFAEICIGVAMLSFVCFPISIWILTQALLIPNADQLLDPLPLILLHVGALLSTPVTTALITRNAFIKKPISTPVSV